MKKFKKRKKGFTLIELLAVIVILAIILAISIPSVIQSINNSRENAFKSSLRNIYKAAQNEAIETGKDSGNIADLKFSNNNISGVWSYDSDKKIVYLCQINDKNYTLTNSEVSPNGIGDCIKSPTIGSEVKINENVVASKLSDINNTSLIYGEINPNGYILDSDYKKNTEPYNYVWYSGKMWRIYKKDSTGIWLITDQPMTQINYGANATNTYKFSVSYAKDWLDNVFTPTLNIPVSDNGAFLKVVNFDTTAYTDSIYGYVNSAVRSSTQTSVSTKAGLISFADLKPIIQNSKLNGGGYCYSASSQLLTQYTDQASCEGGTYSCSDSYYSDQTSCENAGYCSEYISYSMPEYDGDEYSCYNNSGWYDGYYCYYSQYIDRPEYVNDPNGCYNAGYEFNGGYNYWGSNWWSSTINSYLNKESYFWTITSNNSNPSRSWLVNSSFDLTYGYGNYSTGDNATYGIRPVIVLNPDNANATIISGNGSQYNPYKLKMDESSNQSNDLNNKLIGEYVTYSGYKWRIQDKSSGIRLIMNSTITTKPFASPENNVFNPSSTSNIGYYLNNDFLNSLNQSKIINSTFYLGRYDSGLNYTLTKTDKTYADVTVKVGLPRIGEMFTGQNMLNDNYTKNAKSFFTLSPYAYGASYVYAIDSNGYSYPNNTSYSSGIRPVITINSSSTISSGSGTFNDPYVIQ